MCFGDMKSGHSSYVINGCWGRGLRPGWKQTSPRKARHISLQHHKNCLASLLVQGHPVERKKFYISAGSGCRLADKVVSIARQRTSMTCFKDFQNPTGSRVPHTRARVHARTHSKTVFNLMRYFIHYILFTRAFFFQPPMGY